LATRKQKIKVSVFLLACVGIFTVATLVITRVYQDAGDNYWLEFDESILGLYEGGLVEYQGVPVGKVSNIFVTPRQKPHVEVTIDPKKVQLRRGVEGRLVIYSIAAGTMAISLSGGDPNAPILPPGSQIPTKRSTIEAISKQLTDVMERVSNILDDVEKKLAAIHEDDIQEIMGKVKGILNKGDELASKGSTFMDETTGAVRDAREEIRKVAAMLAERNEDLKKVMKSLQDLLETSRGKVAELDVRTVQERLTRTLDDISALSRKAAQMLDQAGTVAENVTREAGDVEYGLRQTMGELRDTFTELRLLVEELRREPSQVVRGKPNVIGPSKDKDNRP